MPHEQLEQLRRDVRNMKKNPLGTMEEGSVLIAKIDELNRSMTKLVRILEDANRSIIQDFERQNPTERLNQVLDQNQKIAQGIVALADMIRKMRDDLGPGATPARTPPQASSSGFNSSPSFNPAPSFSQAPGLAGPFNPANAGASSSAGMGQDESFLKHSPEGIPGFGAQGFPMRPPIPSLGTGGAGSSMGDMMPPPPLPPTGMGALPPVPAFGPSGPQGGFGAPNIPSPMQSSAIPPPPTRGKGLFSRLKS